MTSDEGKKGVRVNWHGAESKGHGAESKAHGAESKAHRDRGRGQQVARDFVGVGDEEYAEKGIMNKEFKKEKRWKFSYRIILNLCGLVS